MLAGFAVAAFVLLDTSSDDSTPVPASCEGVADEAACADEVISLSLGMGLGCPVVSADTAAVADVAVGGAAPRVLSAASSPPASNASAVIAAPMTNFLRGEIWPIPVIAPVAAVIDGIPESSLEVTPVLVT